MKFTALTPIAAAALLAHPADAGGLRRVAMSKLAVGLPAKAPGATCHSGKDYCDGSIKTQKYTGDDICQKITDEVFLLTQAKQGERISFVNHGHTDLHLYANIGQCKGGSCPDYLSQPKLPICDTGFKIPSNGELDLHFMRGFSGNFHLNEGSSKQGTLFEVTFDVDTGLSHADISVIPQGCPGSCFGDPSHKKGVKSNFPDTCDTECDSCPDYAEVNCIPSPGDVKARHCYGMDACPTSVWAAKKYNFPAKYHTQVGLRQCCFDRGTHKDGFDYGIKMTPSQTDDLECVAIDCFDPTKEDQCLFAYKTPHNDHGKLMQCSPGIKWTIDIYPSGVDTPKAVKPQIQQPPCEEEVAYNSMCPANTWVDPDRANGCTSGPRNTFPQTDKTCGSYILF